MNARAACLLALIALAFSSAASAASVAGEIAGLRLGENISAYQGRIQAGATETDLATPFLTTAALAPVPGYRSGYVTWGNCAQPGRIARIKMNYADDSRDFYERVLSALKKRYGQPAQWRGNPFGTLRIWKWSVKEERTGEPVSIILQHYSGGDDAFTRGNSIRISSAAVIREERECHGQAEPRKPRARAPELPDALDLEHFLPH